MIQTTNKTVFIPEKTHKQNLSPYQHKVCTPIWNIPHILSILLLCCLQRNDQCSTYNQRLVLVCVGARPILRYKDLILSASYVRWNKETTVWKSRSVSTPRDGTHALIQAVCHSSVLYLYIFLEIQVTEEWRVQLDSYTRRLSQETPDLRIEQKMSDTFQS